MIPAVTRKTNVSESMRHVLSGCVRSTCAKKDRRTRPQHGTRYRSVVVFKTDNENGKLLKKKKNCTGANRTLPRRACCTKLPRDNWRKPLCTRMRRPYGYVVRIIETRTMCVFFFL
uniref:Uncharacterized protein n=1 Tax=Sipha flava TaxID=143950 RepID=A0A2S2QQZ9_9HEMI